LYIKEQTTQWPKEKVQKDKQRSTKHTHKTKVRCSWYILTINTTIQTQTYIKTRTQHECT
jgi:hypothetical protein